MVTFSGIFEDMFREKIYVLVAKTHKYRGVPVANFGGYQGTSNAVATESHVH